MKWLEVVYLLPVRAGVNTNGRKLSSRQNDKTFWRLLLGGECMGDYWSTELFEKDIKTMNYMQLADWLTDCRNHINRNSYDSYNDYVSDVAYFCLEWEDFYNKHEEEYGSKSVFRSEKFKKALLYTGLKQRYKFVFDGKEYKEQLPIDTYESLTSSFFRQEQLDEINQTFNDTFEKVQAIVNEEYGFKFRLDEVIKSGVLFDDFVYTYRAIVNNKVITAPTYKETIKLLDEVSTYELRTHKRVKKGSFYRGVENFDISTTVYDDYVSLNRCEQEFNKKTFINLSFVLCYNASDAEKFLKFNGYSIKDKSRQFDIICEKALRIGFDRQMVIALIDKYNQDKAKEFDVYKPIANLTKSRKG